MWFQTQSMSVFCVMVSLFFYLFLIVFINFTFQDLKMQALEIQGIKMQALLIAMHLFFDLLNSACFMFQKLLSLFCFHTPEVH